MIKRFADGLVSTLQGKTTAFLVAFFITGNALQFMKRLDATYITFFSLFMSIVLGHSIKTDMQTAKMTDNGQRPDQSGTAQTQGVSE